MFLVILGVLVVALVALCVGLFRHGQKAVRHEREMWHVLVDEMAESHRQSIEAANAIHMKNEDALRIDALHWKNEHIMTVERMDQDHRAAMLILKEELNNVATARAMEVIGHDIERARLAGEIAVLREKADRYDVLTAGHDFHIGGKAVSHGRAEQLLYNCVTCDANIRVMAPAGFFRSPEVE